MTKNDVANTANVAASKPEAKPVTAAAPEKPEVKAEEKVPVLSLDEILAEAAKGKTDAEKQKIAFELLSKTRVGSRTGKGPNQPRPDRMYVINVKAVAPDSKNVPPQMAAVQAILKVGVAVAGRNKLSEAEVFELIENAHKQNVIRTKQSPIRIFKYYKKPLEEIKFLTDAVV